jgi:hypothetical protein
MQNNIFMKYIMAEIMFSEFMIQIISFVLSIKKKKIVIKNEKNIQLNRNNVPHSLKQAHQFYFDYRHCLT